MDRQTIETNFQLAEDYINKNGLGYLEIVGVSLFCR
jgi:hypothetical protein